MTPKAYFRAHPDACGPAVRFCLKFKTMRDAWLSPRADILHMLWGLSKDEANRGGIVRFAAWCAEQDSLLERYGAARAFRRIKVSSPVFSCYYHALDAAVAMLEDNPTSRWAAIRRRQRARLRELFPEMFRTKRKGVP